MGRRSLSEADRFVIAFTVIDRAANEGKISSEAAVDLVSEITREAAGALRSVKRGKPNVRETVKTFGGVGRLIPWAGSKAELIRLLKALIGKNLIVGRWQDSLFYFADRNGQSFALDENLESAAYRAEETRPDRLTTIAF